MQPPGERNWHLMFPKTVPSLTTLGFVALLTDSLHLAVMNCQFLQHFNANFILPLNYRTLSFGLSSQTIIFGSIQ